MATRSMRYDSPAYLVPLTVSKETAAGASAVGAKYVAFTTMLLKSATVMLTTTGTLTAAGNTNLTFKKLGTATTSVGFVNLNPYGTSTVNQVGTNVTLTGTLTQGEMIAATNGTDATFVTSVTYEFLISPGADITA